LSYRIIDAQPLLFQNKIPIFVGLTARPIRRRKDAGKIMIAELTAASIFEAGMMICFGLSWPLSILKIVRSKRTEGKSQLFLFIIIIGYLSGIAAKFFKAGGGLPDWVTLLYAYNAVLVTIDLLLTIKYSKRPVKEADFPS